MSTPVLHYSPKAGGITVDLDRLIASRALIQANSGAGKSRAGRQLLEETHGRVQQLIIDPEGEFATLREKFPYVLAGKEGDVPATPKTAKLLCRKLMQLGASAILDLSDLSLHDRREFVRLFLLELMALPRNLWRPTIVFVDEAHTFFREVGKVEPDSVESAGIALGSQGRKRGYCVICATQRLSKLHKDLAAELLNKMIGRTGLDIDLRRAGEDLGFDKERRQDLKRLEPGEFFVYGPAITNEVQKVKTGPVRTRHPEAAGQLGVAPPPAPASIKGILSQLGDLPAEAEAEARTLATLEAELRDVRLQLRKAQSSTPAPSVEQLEAHAARAVRAHVQKVDASHRAIAGVLRELKKVAGAMCVDAARIETSITSIESALASDASAATAVARAAGRDIGLYPKSTALSDVSAAVPDRRPERSPVSSGTDLPIGERKILIAIAQNDDGVEREQLTILSGYKKSSRDSYISRLQAKGFVAINSGRTIKATDEGIAALGTDYEPLPTGDALREYWLSRLPIGEQLILKAVCEAWPDSITRDELTDRTNYKKSSRDSYISRLAARRLVESSSPARVRAADTLF